VRSGAGSRLTGALVLATVLAVALAVVQGTWAVDRYARQFVHEDDAIVWEEARDLAHLELHTPNLYGQAYGSWLEAVPVAVADRLGVGPVTATPVTLVALTLGSWWMLALAAWRRGRPVLGLAAASAPLVLSTWYTLYTATYVTAAGRFLVVAGVALLLGPRSGRRSVAVGALVSLGLVADPSAIILAGPAVAWWTVRHPDRRALARQVALGTVPALAWLGVGAWFDHAHPDNDLHPRPRTRPSWDVLVDVVPRVGERLGWFTLELADVAALPVLAGLVLLVACAARGSVAARVTAATAVGVVLWSLAAPAALNGSSSPVFPWARGYLAYPFLLWWLALVVREEGGFAIPVTVRRVATVALGMVVVVSVGARWSRFDDDVRALRAEAARHVELPLFSDEALDVACGEALVLAGDGLVVFERDPVYAYGCSALHGIPTLLPHYERRTWRLEEEARTARSSIVVMGAVADWCTDPDGVAASCRYVPGRPDAVVLTVDPPRSALEVLASYGLRTRAFGPGCDPATGDQFRCT
jgi:hypothetical protein